MSSVCPRKWARVFNEEEDKPGAPRVVVISDRLWTRVFQRDPNIVGRAVDFHGQPFTVTGVMPPEMDSPRGVDAWFSVMRRSANPAWQNRANHPTFYGWGRLKKGVTRGAGAQEIKAIAARLEKLYPATNAGFSAEVKPLLENLLGRYRTNLDLVALRGRSRPAHRLRESGQSLRRPWRRPRA